MNQKKRETEIKRLENEMRFIHKENLPYDGKIASEFETLLGQSKAYYDGLAEGVKAMKFVLIIEALILTSIFLLVFLISK